MCWCCRARTATTRWVDELALAVEVVVSTTRTVDEVLKPVLYERAGVPAYWMLDAEEARLTVLELENGRYVERACGQRRRGVRGYKRPFFGAGGSG